ncbi:hypothetical protein F5Y18DRAFT_56927 [Xylariaceae sp. FL1019]|nr:hypothetical protein F5Y18DRAFT_56927 [Xylariaceae sp. FL1019]
MPWPWSSSSSSSSSSHPPSQPTAPESKSASDAASASDASKPAPKVSTSRPIVRPDFSLESKPVSIPYDVQARTQRKDGPSSFDELLHIGTKAFKTGAVTGGAGVLFGAGAGILRSAPPYLFAAAAGIQWFVLGSTFMASKGLICHAWGGEDTMDTSALVKASGAAGGIAGTVGGMLRGPRNILPGMLVFASLGAGGSYLAQHSAPSNQDKPKTSWLDSRWSPMTKLSDREYMEKLDEKILRIDAEIAVIDDSIASIKEAAKFSDTPVESKDTPK